MTYSNEISDKQNKNKNSIIERASVKLHLFCLHTAASTSSSRSTKKANTVEKNDLILCI